MIFDTHAHYDDEQFNEDRVELLNSMEEQGVGTIINVSATYNSCRKVIALAKEYPFVYAAVGIHPDEVGSLNEETFAQMKELFKEEKVVAVGEIGLDYYWDKSFTDLQKEVFIKQVKLANELGLPISIHDREAHKDTFDILKEYNKSSKIVMHCFSGSVEYMKECVKEGWYIALGGVVTFKNAVKMKDVAKEVPLDRLLLETDAPYLTPVPFRGTTNQPAYVKYVAEEIAKLREITFEEVDVVTTKNAKDVFFPKY